MKKITPAIKINIIDMDITNRKNITVVSFTLKTLFISTALLVTTVACQTIKSDDDTENKISNINQKEFVNPYLSNTKYYNTPSIQAKKESLLIEGKGEPAGLFLTYKLDSDKRYRVKVTGHSQQGQTALRVRRDENEPDYSIAPDGSTDLVLFDVEEVEFLLYNDQAFAYELNSIQIEECPTCKTDEDLRQMLLTENQKELVNSYFSNAKYHNKPFIQAKKDSLLIEGKGQPAGLFFTYKIDPNKRYRVKVTGYPQQGQTALRVRRDENEPDYYLAPDGSTDLVLFDVEEVEFLLYNEQAFAYELNSIQIEECPTCKTDEDLRQMLLTEIPALKESLQNDRLHAARLLLNWASNVGDFAISPEIREITNLGFSKKSASQIYYDIFDSNNGGVYCGGMSVFFDKLLKLFDYDSFTINFGHKQDDLTHVTVIVSQKQSDGWLYYIFDPTFNATFRSPSTKQHLTVSEMINFLKANQTNQIYVESLSLKQRDFLILREDRFKRNTRNEKLCEVFKFKIKHRDWVSCSSPNYSIYVYFDRWNHIFLENGYSSGLTGFLELLTSRIFSVGSSLNPEASQQFISEIKSLGIPYGYSNQN